MRHYGYRYYANCKVNTISKQKIAIITDQFPPRFGGMASHAYHIARYLSTKHVVVVLKKRNPTKDYSDERFKVINIITRRFPTLDLIFIILYLVRFKPDVVHVCTAGLNYITLSKMYPVVARVVGNDFIRPWAGYYLFGKYVFDRMPDCLLKDYYRYFEMAIRKRIVNERMKRTHRIVANSEWTYSELINRGVKKEKLSVISGGVDINRYYPAENEDIIKEEIGISIDRFVLLSVCILNEKKTQLTLAKMVTAATAVSPSGSLDSHHISTI